MRIPFYKAQGAGNDFLLTWEADLSGQDRSRLARAICERHRGVGADGWYVLSSGEEGCAARIHLYNSDGSQAELSGNGTRCAAAVLADSGYAGDRLRISTGAGIRDLRILRRQGRTYFIEMNMGPGKVKEGGLRHHLQVLDASWEATLVDVGNPQCVLFVEDFRLDWPAVGAAIESHRDFPNKSNVSFVRVLNRHTLDVRFYERGAGVTLSSGTGATGAVVAAVARGLADSPVTVLTGGEPLDLRQDGDWYLTGPATVIAKGEYFYGSDYE